MESPPVRPGRAPRLVLVPRGGGEDYLDSRDLDVDAEPFQLRLSSQPPGRAVHVTSLKVLFYCLKSPHLEATRATAAELQRWGERAPEAAHDISRARASLEKSLEDPEKYDFVEERDGPTGLLSHPRPLQLGSRPGDFLMVELLGECKEGKRTFKIKQRHWVHVLP